MVCFPLTLVLCSFVLEGASGTSRCSILKNQEGSRVPGRLSFLIEVLSELETYLGAVCL